MNSQQIANLEKLVERTSVKSGCKTYQGAEKRYMRVTGTLCAEFQYRIVMRRDGRYMPAVILADHQTHWAFNFASRGLFVTDLRSLDVLQEHSDRLRFLAR